MTPLLAGIPYETFPDFTIGPVTIRTFGLMVGIGVLLGAWVAARDLERWGVDREETYRLATRMVVWGLVGSRVTWVLSHLDQIEDPIDVIAVWEGGIQFSGGFIAAVLVGLPTFRKWDPVIRWRSLDGYAYGLTIGLAIGRIGCYAVGEHFGRSTDFFLGTTFEGGSTQEPIPLPGGRLVSEAAPEAIGATFHNTSLYEFGHLLVLFGLMSLLHVNARRRSTTVPAGTIMGLFCVWYGVGRFLTDTVRINDQRVLMMTGAQWAMIALTIVGLYVLVRVRPKIAALEAERAAEPPAGSDHAGESPVDEVTVDEVTVDDEPSAESTE